MSIKETIAQVRAKLSDEELSKVSSLLSQAERQAQDIISDLSSANSESKGRKEKIRELEGKLDEVGDSGAKYKDKISKLNDEIKRLKGIEEQHNKIIESEQNKQADLWKSRKTTFEVEESDATYEKIQKVAGKFQLGDELTPDQIKNNNTLYDTYEEIGYFKVTSPDVNEQHAKGSPTKKVDPYKDVYEQFK